MFLDLQANETRTLDYYFQADYDVQNTTDTHDSQKAQSHPYRVSTADSESDDFSAQLPCHEESRAGSTCAKGMRIEFSDGYHEEFEPNFDQNPSSHNLQTLAVPSSINSQNIASPSSNNSQTNQNPSSGNSQTLAVPSSINSPNIASPSSNNSQTNQNPSSSNSQTLAVPSSINSQNIASPSSNNSQTNQNPSNNSQNQEEKP